MPHADAPQTEPLVSVIVPAFNAAATLAATLSGVAEQSHRHLEILIVDDGSTDATAAVAQAFCEREPRARLVRQNNRGVAAARNRGLALARGEFVAPLDADDLWHPDKLARQVEAARASGAGFVSCWFRDLDEAGGVWRDGPQTRHSGAVYLRMVWDNFVGNGSALLVRREAALGVGGYDETLRAEGRQGCEDLLFQLRLAERYRAAVVPAYLVGYRARDDAMSADPAAMFASWLLVRQHIELDRPGAAVALRWAMARRRWHLAEALAWRGRWVSAARHGLPALIADPHRTVLALRRLVVRRFSTRPKLPERMPYAALDPDCACYPVAGDALARLEARRDALLAAYETPSSDR